MGLFCLKTYKKGDFFLNCSTAHVDMAIVPIYYWKLMALDYLRQNPLADVCGDPPEAVKVRSVKKKKSTVRKKLPKGKFTMLLGGNLIVWMVFLVSVFDLKVFSMPSLSMPKMPQKLAVSGIVYNKEEPTVIISSQVYGIGDEVDGYTIVEITPNHVEFQNGDETLIRQVR